MEPHFLKSSPILGCVRWSAASISNYVHFEHGAHVVGETAVPVGTANAINHTAAATWANIADFATTVVVSGLIQLAEAAVANPFAAITVIWWLIETYLLAKVPSAWLAKKRIKKVPVKGRRKSRARQAAAPSAVAEAVTDREAASTE